MALSNPIYNLEEELDIYLKHPYEKFKNLKGCIEAIIEDGFISDIPNLDKQWLELLDIVEIGEEFNIEIFYVVKLLKKFTVDTSTSEGINQVTFPIGSKVLIPQSYINTEKTTNMQLEPNTFVLDFSYDYTVESFKDPEDMMNQIKEFVLEKSKNLVDVTFRQVSLYSEQDLSSIIRLLKIYYNIDLPDDLLDPADNKKPNTAYGDYNRNSIKNVLSSVTNSQIVVSSSSFSDKTVINKKIEISLVPNEQRKLQCVIYNRTKREERIFKY